MTEPRFSPHNIEAEQALLGAIFINNQAWHRVCDILQPEDFFEPIHTHIYELCSDLIKNGKVATPVTIRSFIASDLKVAHLTISQYLARLAAEATTIINASDYAQAIRDLADQRRIEIVGESLRHELAIDPIKLATEGIEQLDAIVASRTNTGAPALTMEHAVTRAMDSAAASYQRDGAIPGLATGLLDLDAKTLGLQEGELFILAGRPGMGKTALALTITKNAAINGKRSLLVSLEMGDVQLTQRLLSEHLYHKGHKLSYWLIHSGRFSAKDFELIVDATKEIGHLPIRIEQQPGLTVQQIATRARQLKRRDGLDLLVVDHLHLVRPSDRYKGHRVEEIGEVTRGLKAIAKDLGIAVLALCQLSRAVEARDDKRPSMADLRGSGDIEQDADTIAMLYREAYYLERRKPQESSREDFAEWLSKMDKLHNRLEILIEKQRNGPIGSVPVFIDVAYNAVRNLELESHLPTDPQEALPI